MTDHQFRIMTDAELIAEFPMSSGESMENCYKRGIHFTILSDGHTVSSLPYDPTHIAMHLYFAERLNAIDVDLPTEHEIREELFPISESECQDPNALREQQIQVVAAKKMISWFRMRMRTIKPVHEI